MGEFGLGLCLALDQLDQVKCHISRPAADRFESWVKLDDSFLEGSRVSIIIGFGQNSPDLAENSINLAKNLSCLVRSR